MTRNVVSILTHRKTEWRNAGPNNFFTSFTWHSGAERGNTSPSSCGIYNTRRVWHPSGVFGVLGLEIEVARDVPGTELEIVLRHGRLHPAAECAEGLGHLPELVDGNAIDLAPVLKDATAKDANTKLKKSKVRRHKS